MPGKKQKEHTYTLDGFITGEAGGGGADIRNNLFVSKWMGLYPGGLKTMGGGGGFKHGIVRYTIKCLGSL